MANLNDACYVQNNEDDGDNEQRMDNIAGAWNSGEDIRTKVSEQPQDEQNYNNQGKHNVSPIVGILFYAHHTINRLQAHPSAGECCTPPLGGEIILDVQLKPISNEQSCENSPYGSKHHTRNDIPRIVCTNIDPSEANQSSDRV